MLTPFSLAWSQNGQLVRGYKDGNWVDGSLSFPVSFPGSVSVAESISLQNGAAFTDSLTTLNNVRIYLTGDGADVEVVQTIWPYLGDAFTPARTEMNGGFEISFDGINYTRFSKTVGYESDPTTWIDLPKSAIGGAGTAGQLGPFQVAHFTVRYTIPAVANVYRNLDIQLGVDFDII